MKTSTHLSVESKGRESMKDALSRGERRESIFQKLTSQTSSSASATHNPSILSVIPVATLNKM